MPSEDRREFSTLVARLPVAIFRTAPDGRILMANQALADLLGYESVAELQRLHASDLYADPADRDEVARRLLDGTMPASNEILLRRKDGTVVWTRARAHAIDDGKGPRYFEGVLIEISEQKQAEVRLRASEDRFRTVFLASPVGMLIGGPDLRVRAANPAICSLLELTEEELIDAPISDLFVDDTGPRAAAVASMLAGDRDHHEGEHRLVTAGGDVKTVLTHLTAFRPAHGEHGLLGQFVDITDRRRMQEKLEQLVRSKDELVRSVSHELRTPLTSVVGFASELEERGDLTESERGELIGYIAEQSREMAELVEDLLAAARAGVGPVNVTPEPMDLVEACRDILSTWRDQTVRFVAGADRVGAWADPIRVRQIMRNLLTNAARYGSPPVELRVDADRSGAAIEVTDGGPALPPDEWEAIFEPYRRAHGTGDGVAVGLGLAVSRRLARMMAGELSYRSENGNSVFELRLPAEPARPDGRG